MLCMSHFKNDSLLIGYDLSEVMPWKEMTGVVVYEGWSPTGKNTKIKAGFIL